MRASVVIASFAALAASSPVNVPFVGDVAIPFVPEGVIPENIVPGGADPAKLAEEFIPKIPGLSKRTFETLPLNVVSNLPVDISKLGVDFTKLPAGASSLADIASLPVNVSGLPTGSFDFFGSFLKLADFSKLPLNPFHLPTNIQDIVGQFTSGADLTKIPIDISKLTSYGAVLGGAAQPSTSYGAPATEKPSTGYGLPPVKPTGYSKRTLSDFPALASVANLAISQAQKYEVQAGLLAACTPLKALVAPTSPLFGNATSILGRADSPSISADEVANAIKFAIRVIVSVAGDAAQFAG